MKANELETAKALVHTMNFIKRNWIILVLIGVTQTPFGNIVDLVTGKKSSSGSVLAKSTELSKGINIRLSAIETSLAVSAQQVIELGQLQKEFTELLGHHLRNPEIHEAGLNVVDERIKVNKEDIKDLKEE